MITFTQLDESMLDQICAIELAAQFVPWSKQKFQDSLAAGHYTCGLLLSNKLVGYAIVLPVLDEAELLNICIASEYQSQGYGKQLLQQVFTWLKQQGIKQLFLEVHADNQQAIAFYQSAGFQQVGIRKNYYQPGDGLIFHYKFTD